MKNTLTSWKSTGLGMCGTLALILAQPKVVDMLTSFDWEHVTRKGVIGLVVSLLPFVFGAITKDADAK